MREGFFFSSRRRHTRFDCDWSSDVCSSDLLSTFGRIVAVGPKVESPTDAVVVDGTGRDVTPGLIDEIGRASCRERGEISGVAVSLKKKKTIIKLVEEKTKTIKKTDVTKETT